MHLADGPARLVHERRGSGPPLVLIHGLGSHWQVWLPVLDAVAGHRDTIALDLPGFGASPPWPGGEPDGGSVRHLTDHVVSFLDSLGVHRPHVAGNSLGGAIALELGRRGLARSVVAFAPAGFWSGPGRRWCQVAVSTARAVAGGLAPVMPGLLGTRPGRVALCGLFYGRPARLDPAEAARAAAALATAPGLPAARAAFRELRLDSADPGELARIPVTVAWGTRDLLLPYRAQARRARAALPGAHHVALRGCGHVPFSDDPQACVRLLTGDA